MSRFVGLLQVAKKSKFLKENVLSVLQLLKSNHSLMLILAFADDNLLEVFGWSSTRNIQQNSLLYFWVEIFCGRVRVLRMGRLT